MSTDNGAVLGTYPYKEPIWLLKWSDEVGTHGKKESPVKLSRSSDSGNMP